MQEQKEEIVKEFERDDSLDYVKILRALLDIPFPIGKKLLIDFLTGSYKNDSIVKNKPFSGVNSVNQGYLFNFSLYGIKMIIQTYYSFGRYYLENVKQIIPFVKLFC